MKLVWLPRAQQLRYAQLEYIAETDPLAAVRADEEIECQAELLPDNPNMGRPGRIEGTRELVVGRTPFILVYRVHPEAGRIEIWRLLHGAQRWPPQERG
ncbi:MAG: type II toxin-antitoxin system RelE/ParE family toxin [Pseudomonas sp.]